MPEETKDAAADVWALTLATYAGEGVAAACIGLQDRHGVGVSVLLALMGLAALGHPVPDARAMDAVLQRAEAWQRRVIEPLRGARRSLPHAAPAVIEDSAKDVRRALLAQEIETERLQQQLIVADSLGIAAVGGMPPPGREWLEAVEQVARLYLSRFVEDWTDIEESALRALLDAMASDGVGPSLD